MLKQLAQSVKLNAKVRSFYQIRGPIAKSRLGRTKAPHEFLHVCLLKKRSRSFSVVAVPPKQYSSATEWGYESDPLQFTFYCMDTTLGCWIGRILAGLLAVGVRIGVAVSDMTKHTATIAANVECTTLILLVSTATTVAKRLLLAVRGGLWALIAWTVLRQGAGGRLLWRLVFVLLVLRTSLKSMGRVDRWGRS